MQKKYESPEMDVVELEDRDVIVASALRLFADFH